MEEKQKRMEQELEMEMKIKKKEMEFKRAIERKRMLMENQLREEEEEQNRKMQEDILRQRKKQLKRMEMRQQSFDHEMKAMDEAMARLQKFTVKVSTTKQVDAGEGTSGEQKKVPSAKLGKLTNEDLLKLEAAQDGNVDKNGDIENDSDDESEDESEDTSDNSSEKSKETKKSEITKNVDRLSQHGQGQVRAAPTKTQLAARSGVSKKLPMFSGKPEDWPLFYGMYQASTEACGYSDIENLVRLQECLKGQALEMVRGQLHLPKSVPRVIEKLRQLYGRPEQLLQSHLEKVLEKDWNWQASNIHPFRNGSRAAVRAPGGSGTQTTFGKSFAYSRSGRKAPGQRQA
ncbi:moesin-like isoform X2 [Toxorhynchites rutilus septentrionalis]|uniref:moesin-like isoform X2 n=1 Tax=Toxorhynchites rutilus septentrionalis TaxID=329112 RepID=UPI00247A0D6C|nr:moesin-like isoform X2 [Toxorhynchites rutilus septentrionalis]